MIHKSVKNLCKLLKDKGMLGIAESFTGGAVCAEIVKHEGVSNFLKKAIVCYSYESKMDDLGVSRFVLENYGAVSEQCTSAMLNGILNNHDCDFAIVTTGNAGPTAETEGEEGLCFVGVGTKQLRQVFKFQIYGKRELVINSGTTLALEKAVEFFKDLV